MHPLIDIVVGIAPAAIVLVSSVLGARGHYKAATVGGLCGLVVFAILMIGSSVAGLYDLTSLARW